jgi:hypothetical protein
MHSWSTFGARTRHGQIQTHKIHHGQDLGKTTTFPLIVYSVPGHGTSTQMTFCLGTPKILTIGTFVTLGAHNFACKPLIEMRFKENFYPSLRTFQRYVARHLHIGKLGRFPTFSARESNCQFDFRLFFWP